MLCFRFLRRPHLVSLSEKGVVSRGDKPSATTDQVPHRRAEAALGEFLPQDVAEESVGLGAGYACGIVSAWQRISSNTIYDRPIGPLARARRYSPWGGVHAAMRPDLTTPPRDALTPRIYHLVRSIPPGRVMTYGGVAAELGAPRRAREVGWALGRVGPADDVPCHRVLLSTGRSSHGYANGHPELQRMQLEAEGVIFRTDGSINLQHYMWWPPDEALEHDLRPLP